MKRIFLAIILVFLFVPFIPSQGQAASYFIQESCATPGDGTTGQCDGGADDAWDDLSDVTGLSANDKLYLKCGETWTLTQTTTWLTINQAGVYVGAYYDDGAQDAEKSDTGSWTNASYCNGGARPKLAGSAIEGGARYPDYNNAMIKVDGVDNVSIEFIHFYHSGDKAIVTTNNADSGVIAHNIMERCFNSCISTWAGAEGSTSTGWLIEHNEISESVYCNSDTVLGLWCADECGSHEISNCATTACCQGGVSAATIVCGRYHFTGADTPDMVGSMTVQYNKFSKGYGEAFNTCNGNTYQYNTFSDFAMPILNLTSHSDLTARYNVVLCVDNPSAGECPTCDYNSSGIKVDSENSSYPGQNVKVYGNIVSRCKNNLFLGDTTSTATSDIYIYNNLFIDGYNSNIAMTAAFRNNVTNVHIKNNASIHLTDTERDGGTANHVLDWSSGQTPATYYIDYNYWSTAVEYSDPEGKDWSGANDRVAGTIGLPTPASPGGGWWSIQNFGHVDLSLDFFFEQGANVLGGGVDLANTTDDCVADITYACGLTDDSTNFEATPIAISFGDRDDNQWDMGPPVWGSPPTPVPDEVEVGGGSSFGGGAGFGG